MLDIKAKECWETPASTWVRRFILTCDCKLAVQFKDIHHPEHPRIFHPKPDVCCYYPFTNITYYQLAIQSDPGRFVHHYLYKKQPYQIIKPPCPPDPLCKCAGVGTAYPVLHATVVATGDCGCMSGTYPLTWSQGVGVYQLTNQPVCGSLPLFVELVCEDGGSKCQAWALSMSCANVAIYDRAPALTSNTDPPSFTFPTVNVPPGYTACCPGSGGAGGGGGLGGTIGVTVTS